MKIAFDTNRYSDLERGDPATAESFRAAGHIYIPFVVVAELRFGFLHGSKRSENERKLHRFLSSRRVEVLYADEQTIHEYARLAHQLRTQGTPIPTNDIWIAALTLQHGLTLCARDRHFDHLPQLPQV